jgi:hypothetical protein
LPRVEGKERKGEERKGKERKGKVLILLALCAED